jgi:ligand-binding sensor domain-containing protein/signal transduction histidine kinase
MNIFQNRCLSFAFGASLFMPARAPSQEIKFQTLSIEHGLSQNTVYALAQDSLGFMWFGTKDGLNQYDGYNFISHKNDPFEPNTLSDNLVQALYVDRAGILWVGTSQGLNKLNLQTGRVKRYLHEPGNPNSLSHNYVHEIAAGRTGALWIGTDGGLNHFDPETERFTSYKNDPLDTNSLSNNQIYALLEDHAGVLWVGSVQGLNAFDPSTKKFLRYQHDPADPGSLSHNEVFEIFEDHTRKLWIGTRGGLNQWHRETGQFIRFQYTVAPGSLSDDRVSAIEEDQFGNLWVGTLGGGLNQLDPSTRLRQAQSSRSGHSQRSGKFFHYKNNPVQLGSLSSNAVWSICRDRSGALWIGTAGGGVNKIVTRTKQFHTYTTAPEGPAGLSNKFVRAFCEDRFGALWIGTYGGGLNRLDRQSGVFTHFKNDPANSRSLSHNVVWSIYEDRAGTLWIGTRKGLNRFDRETQSFTSFQHDPANPQSLSDNDVATIYEDKMGTLWIGTYNNGLNQFDRRTLTFKRYQPDPANPQSLSHQAVLCLFEDRMGTLWIGTDGGGLNQFDRQTETFISYKKDPGSHGNLSHNSVRCIYEDRSGALWIGTSHGLNKFDRATRIFTSYFEKDGLPNDFIYGMLGDVQDNLWLSTNHGLAKFDTRLGKFQSYDVNDGLQSNEFNTGAYFQNQRGEMFFGGVNGFTVFYPDQIQSNPYRPPVVLTAFRKFDKAAELDTAISAIKRLELSHKDNFFAFEFAALDYTAPEKNRYAYKLEGFDQNWIDAGTRRYASYTNLDPGAYVFRVKGSNNDGMWNETGAAVRIIITPPVWKTWWFRILALAAFSGLLAQIYRYRVKRLLEMERLRVRIASDLHDDIGATLTKISLHSELIEESNEPSEIRESLRKIGAMSRELVTTMSDIVWSIDARNDTLGNLVDRMRDFATGVLAVRATQIDFNCAGLDMQKKLPVDFRQNIYLIFKEAINNIAKHAEASRVDVQIKNANGHFNLSIRDDGKGWREHEYAKLSGHGLRNMKMRASRIGGDLNISRNGGCTVSLTTAVLR